MPVRTLLCALVAVAALLPAHIQAQSSPAQDEPTRVGLIEAQQAQKAKESRHYVPNRAEVWLDQVEQRFVSGNVHWHPFFQSAYAGGGFTLGAGYTTFVGPYSTLDVRGSYTISGYKRVEAEYRSPRLFNRRGVLSVLGGWRDATQVGYFGLGTTETSQDDHSVYRFKRPYALVDLDVRPTRGALVIGGGVEFTKWTVEDGQGSYPPVDERFTPEEAPGLGTNPTYLQSHATLAFDWRRPGADYTRRGGYYGVTGWNFDDRDGASSFRQVDYEVIQHIPVLRDAWVLSLRGRAQTTYTDGDNIVPFFMLPALGSGSTLRGFSSWRFRDRNSLLLQAEWRVLVSNFVDTALFVDAGKVTARRSDLDFDGLKSDYGIGIRIHGPAATPIRIEVARSNEGIVLVFGASAVF